MNPVKAKIWSRLLLSAMVAALVVYLFILPAVDSLLSGGQDSIQTGRSLDGPTFGELLRIRTTEVIVAAWFLSLGLIVGSFLNVVVYRIPRGQPLIAERSHCPNCGARIRSRDNLPLLGWWLLHGRCRDCQHPIPARYPIVEAVTGGCFLILFFVELISGGVNLPHRPPNFYRGVVWILLYTKWDLVLLYFDHLFLICTLLAWSLIDWDGFRIPRRSWLTAFAIAGTLPLLWPELLVLPMVYPEPSWYASHPLVRSLSTIAMGGVLGVVVGRVLDSERSRDRTYRPEGPGPALPAGSAGLALVGMVLGWQAAILVATLTLAASVLRRRILATFLPRGLDSAPWSLDLWIATLWHQIFWRVLIDPLSPWWNGSLQTCIYLAFPILIAFLLLGILRHGAGMNPRPMAVAGGSERPTP